MRKVLRAALAVLVLLVSLSISGNLLAAGSFQSDFDTNHDGWTAMPGSICLDDEFQGESILKVNCDTVLEYYNFAVRDGVYDNFEWETKFYLYGAGIHAYMIYFRVDPAYDGTNYIFNHSGYSATLVRRDGKVSFSLNRWSPYASLYSNSDATRVDQGAWNTIRIVAQGSGISVYLNGGLECSITDNGPTSGKLALGTEESSGLVDKIYIDYSNLDVLEPVYTCGEIPEQFTHRFADTADDVAAMQAILGSYDVNGCMATSLDHEWDLDNDEEVWRGWVTRKPQAGGGVKPDFDWAYLLSYDQPAYDAFRSGHTGYAEIYNASRPYRAPNSILAHKAMVPWTGFGGALVAEYPYTLGYAHAAEVAWSEMVEEGIVGFAKATFDYFVKTTFFGPVSFFLDFLSFYDYLATGSNPLKLEPITPDKRMGGLDFEGGLMGQDISQVTAIVHIDLTKQLTRLLETSKFGDLWLETYYWDVDDDVGLSDWALHDRVRLMTAAETQQLPRGRYFYIAPRGDAAMVDVPPHDGRHRFMMKAVLERSDLLSDLRSESLIYYGRAPRPVAATVSRVLLTPSQ